MTSLTTTTAMTSTVESTTDAAGRAKEQANISEIVEQQQQQQQQDNNPMTDIVKETNAITAITADTSIAESRMQKQIPTTITSQLTSPSKIPHLQQQQYTPNLLHSPDHSFRRSASLRVRGTKSNLFNDYNNFMAMEHNTRYMSNIPNAIRYNQPMRGVVCEQQQHEISEQRHTTTATTTTGSFGGAVVRHKAALSFCSTLSKQTPAAIVGNGNLTRSQSLRRSYRNSQQNPYKTDSIKEQNSGDSTLSESSGAASGLGANVVINQEGIKSDNVAPLIENTQLEFKSNVSENVNCISNGKIQTNDIMYKNTDEMGAQRRIDKDMQKMSLNLNGSSCGGERSTTTTKFQIATTGTPTGSGSGNRIVNASTPKTPNNPTAITTTGTTAASSVRYIKSSPIAGGQETTKLTPKTPPVTPDSPCTYLEDDLESMYSFATTTSGRSTMSCEHPYVARNGTTFSGRKMKYVVHCSNYAGQVGPDYLTPTQRAARQIRRLKELLCLARQDLEQKDSEMLRLTREVVELRLFKASLSSPEERSASSDAVTVREAELKTSQDVSPIVDMVDDATKSSPRHIANQQQHLQHQHHHSQQLTSEMQSSFADSGHFEDLSVHSKDSYAAHTQDIACGSDETIGVAEVECLDGCTRGSGADGVVVVDNEDYAATIKNYELQRQELIRIYEQKIEELIRTQDGASSEMKRSHNDKVEALLQKLAECNTRYADIVPDYEHAKERIRELERQLEDLQRKLAEHEDKQNKMYLHMYQKGQEAERIARADQALELAHRAPSNKVSINELLHQLQSTQDELENIRTIYRRLLEAQKNRTHVDPEVTLQFLKSAIYYFLTDKENSQGHLQAIESILEFTDAEKQNINKSRVAK